MREGMFTEEKTVKVPKERAVGLKARRRKRDIRDAMQSHYPDRMAREAASRWVLVVTP